MNQMSDVLNYCKKGVLVVHESDVRCIITVRKECWLQYMNHISDVFITVRKGVLVVHE